ncbi:MAG: hypothetical protein ACPF8V_10960, partial [Luteibaculum sp.]
SLGLFVPPANRNGNRELDQLLRQNNFLYSYNVDVKFQKNRWSILAQGGVGQSFGQRYGILYGNSVNAQVLSYCTLFQSRINILLQGGYAYMKTGRDALEGYWQRNTGMETHSALLGTNIEGSNWSLGLNYLLPIQFSSNQNNLRPVGLIQGSLAYYLF